MFSFWHISRCNLFRPSWIILWLENMQIQYSHNCLISCYRFVTEWYPKGNIDSIFIYHTHQFSGTQRPKLRRGVQKIKSWIVQALSLGENFIYVELLRSTKENAFLILCWVSCVLQGRKIWDQPRPQGLLLVQNGGRRNPWPMLLKYSTNHGVFCHVTHDEMAFSEVVSSVRRPSLFSASGNRYSNKTKTFDCVCVTKF